MTSNRLNARGEKTRDRTRARTSARSSTASAEGAQLFVSLRKILLPHAGALVVTRDVPGDFSLDTRTTTPDGKPLFFGGVRTGRAYTSFYLMPVYTDPALLSGVSEHLRERLRGKACFTFTAIVPSVFDELASLTARCFDGWKTAGKIGG